MNEENHNPLGDECLLNRTSIAQMNEGMRADCTCKPPDNPTALDKAFEKYKEENPTQPLEGFW